MRTLTWLVFLALLAHADEKPLWLAVGPKHLLEPLAPLAEHREDEGLEAMRISGDITEALAKAGRKPAFLLLVGDDAAGAEAEPWYLPAKRETLYRWRAVQPLQFASDAVRADLDGDGLQEFAVGRIPARTPEQVAEVVRKTIAYERRERSPAELRLVVWAGAPGYGAFIDSMATGMLVTTVRRYAPAWLERWMISADARQTLCGWPPEQPALFNGAMRKGSLLNAITAHANADAVFSMKHDNQGIWYTAAHARRHLDGDRPVAPLVLLACNCGEFDRARSSLAEDLLFLPGGPVATIGATTESHPLPNYFTGVGMLKALDGKYGREDRLGSLWFLAQRKAAEEKDPLMENMLRGVEGSLEPEIDVEKLRRDQKRVYALLGDPALRLGLPQKLEAKVARTETGWRWWLQPPAGAWRLHVGVREVRKTPAPALPTPLSDAKARELFREANGATRWAPPIGVDKPWQGEVKEPGLLRLVATGPGVFAVAVLELK